MIHPTRQTYAVLAFLSLCGWMHWKSNQIAQRGQIYDFSYAEKPEPSGVTAILPAANPLASVWVTVYHPRYDGRHTKSGEVYRHGGFTVAVPRPRWQDLKGKSLTFLRAGRKVTVRVNDTVGPGVQNYDLSGGAWDALTKSAPSRTRAEMRVEKK